MVVVVITGEGKGVQGKGNSDGKSRELGGDKAQAVNWKVTGWARDACGCGEGEEGEISLSIQLNMLGDLWESSDLVWP